MVKTKTLLQLAIISISVLLMYSCLNNGDSTLDISGRVIEFDTEKGIPNAKLIVIGGKTNGGFEPPTEFFVDSIFTDSEGSYEWNDKNAISADYYAISSVQKENYFDISTQISIFGNFEEIILDPFAWLHLKAIDDSNISGEYCETFAMFIQPSNFGEFENMYHLKGNRNIEIGTKKGIGEPIENDKIYLAALDTLFYEIRY